MENERYLMDGNGNVLVWMATGLAPLAQYEGNDGRNGWDWALQL